MLTSNQNIIKIFIYNKVEAYTLSQYLTIKNLQNLGNS